MLREYEFKEKCRQFLTASTPIRSVEHLKGRQMALSRMVDALNSPGKHGFIYGNRGVGKTSLAQTSAREVQPTLQRQHLLACDLGSNFPSLCRDIIRSLLDQSPLETKSVRKYSLGGSFQGAGLNASLDRSSDAASIVIDSVNDAVRFLAAAAERTGHESIVVIDEFDLLKNSEDHSKFAILIKQLSDQRINIKLIFCGISESIDELFKAHDSAHRYIHAEALERLKVGACQEIIADASDALQIEIPRHLQYRIAQIADGFPYFVHLICEKMFANAFHGSRKLADQSDFVAALDQAVESIEPRLKRPFEDTVHKNTKGSEHILWALANDDLLDVQLSDVWRHYQRVCAELGFKEMSKANLTTKLNNLSKEAHNGFLTKPRRSYYTFTEKMMRGYARLRAERAGFHVGPENPGA